MTEGGMGGISVSPGSGEWSGKPWSSGAEPGSSSLAIARALSGPSAEWSWCVGMCVELYDGVKDLRPAARFATCCWSAPI